MGLKTVGRSPIVGPPIGFWTHVTAANHLCYCHGVTVTILLGNIPEPERAKTYTPEDMKCQNLVNPFQSFF